MRKKRCRSCRREYERTELNDNKLCKRCAPAERRTLVMKSDSEVSNEIQMLSAKIARCNRIIEISRQLLVYEAQGKELSPSPTVIISRYEKMKMSLLHNALKDATHEGVKSLEEKGLTHSEKDRRYKLMRRRLMQYGELAKKHLVSLSTHNEQLLYQARERDVEFTGNVDKFDGEITQSLDAFLDAMEAEEHMENVDDLEVIEDLQNVQGNLKDLSK
jgi:hypothetical protein